MFTNMLFIISIIVVLLFIVKSFYIDFTNWSNTGNTFAEGLENNSEYQIEKKETSCPRETSSNIENAEECRKAILSFNGGELSKLEIGRFKDQIHKKAKCGLPAGCLFSGKDVHFNKPLFVKVNNQWKLCKSTSPKIAFPNDWGGDTGVICKTKVNNNPSSIPSNVPQECRIGCKKPLQLSGNCKTVDVGGKSLRKCPYGCPVPSFKENNTTECEYDKHCNSCGTTFFNPDVDGPDMPGARPGGFCPEGQDCSPTKGQPTGGIFTDKNWTGSVIVVPGGGPVQPQDNALFNDKIMKQVLANKKLIPDDIDLTKDNQGNFIRVGKGFMNDVSYIRNMSLPSIDNDDYESLGRIIAKIKTQEDGPQNQAQGTKLVKSVNTILSGSNLSKVSWQTSKQTANLKTTGMYGDSSNSLMGYGDKASNNSSSAGKPEGGLCLWKGCDKSKNAPYDSVWSLY